MYRLFSFRKYWPIGIILLLEVFLFATNYIPKTYLIGWDNLFPEFNFPANIQRSIFAVWQEYRGLGLLDGMSHAANITHYIFIYIISFVIPQNLLRYSFTFLMHFLGGLGMYLLISNFSFDKSQDKQFPIYKSGKSKKIIALFGAFFYQYNFGTIQMFYLPFELFIVHFAAIPWSFYLLRKFFANPKRQNLFLLALTSFLATPQAHVPSVFLVYVFAIGSYMLFSFLQHGRQIVKPIIIAMLVIFLTNSFWGIPYVYSTVKNAKTIAQSKNNQMGTDDIFLRNQAYGDFENVAQLKGLSLDFIQYDYTQKISNYMMQPWRNYSSRPIVFLASWILFFISLFGLYWAIVRKCKELYPFAFLWVITFLILGNDIPILGFFSYFLHTYIPYFHNIFRFVFTKFSFLYVAMYSILLTYGLSQIIFFLEEKSKSYPGVILALLYSLLSLTSFPVFGGEFFYKNLRVAIPNDYFQVFDYFKSQNYSERIAILPTPWFWSWTQTNWGAIGSGFTWFGLVQPTLDRAFDPWSDKNENFYWEITQAIYSSDSTLFSTLLGKYQIGWLLLDESIIQTSSPKVIDLGAMEEFLSNFSNISLASQFGKIKIYKVNLNPASKDFVFLADDLPVVGPEYKWNNYDKGYEENGDYISMNNVSMKQLNNDIYYPFRSLFTGRKQEELEFGVEDKTDYFSFKTKIPKELVGYKLTIPSVYGNEVTELDAGNLDKKTVKTPEIYLDGEFVPFATTSANTIDLPYIKEGNVEVRVPKTNGYYSYNYIPTTTNQQPKSCDQFSKGTYTHESVTEGNNELLRLTSTGSSNCLDFDLPSLSQDIGYLVTVENRNIEGKSLLFSVINKNSQRADIETYLPKRSELTTHNPQPITSYFIIPPMEQYGLGYTLHLDNISIGRVKTVNDLGKITVNPIPYRFLTGMKILKGNPLLLQGVPLQNVQVDHPNPSLYQITLRPTKRDSGQASSNTTLVLSQSYDDGWKAYEMKLETRNSKLENFLIQLFPFWFGNEIKDHVLINNWENGWQIGNLSLVDSRLQDNSATKDQRPTTIIIIYLPQYLEYIGFILLGGLILYLLLTKRRTQLT